MLAPERIPWSELGPGFVATWSRKAGRKGLHPEHMEIIGPTGSGKTYFVAKLLQDLAELRDTAVIFIATKPADETIRAIGFPVTDKWRDVAKMRQVIFWPNPKATGTERKTYQAKKVNDLLNRLWQADANTVLVWDEIARGEQLSPETKELIGMYWREARSMRIPVIAMKQRAQGVQRDMHSETTWMACFRPKDEDDAKRIAEILGTKQWVPVLLDLDRERHEFMIKNEITGRYYISWVDTPLKVRKPRKGERSYYRRKNG